MIIRHLKESDVEAVIRLGLLAFPTTTAEGRRQTLTANPRCALSDFFLAEENGVAVGSYAIYPFVQHLRGVDLRMGGIASVAVAPDQRRRGVAAAMMTAAIAEMKQRGYAVSVLYPFGYGFYRKFGWGLAGISHEYAIPALSLPVFEEFRAVRRLAVGEETELCSWYEHAWRTRNGTLKRSNLYWKALLGSKLENVYVYRNPEGRIEGHVAFRFSPTADSLVQDLKVLELLSTTPASWRGLIGFIAAQRDQVRTVHLGLPPDEPLLALMTEPRSADGLNFDCGQYSAAHVSVSWMLRVVDPDLLLNSGMRFGSAETEVCFELHDSITRPDAPLRRRVRFEGGRVSACETVASDEFALSGRRLSCDISAFAQMLAGSLKPSDAARNGVAVCDPSDTAVMLDDLFGCSQAFISPVDSF
jgi:predicted acetyltransferase